MLIYILHNIVNGKYYVGKTEKTLNQRLGSHYRGAKYGGTCTALYRAIRKYGTAAFIAEVLVDGITTREELDKYEQLWITALDATNKSVGYNLTFGGQGGVQTEEVRQRIRKATKKACKSWNRGMKFGTYTDGRNEKISQTLKGRTLSLEHRHAIDIGGIGKHKGSLNPMAKLTQEQVDDLRKRNANGESLSSLANRFGIHYQTAYRIVKGLRWGAVQPTRG
jgi:group I intron endonuclease